MHEYDRLYRTANGILLLGLGIIYVGMLWMAWETGGAAGLIMGGAATAALALVLAFGAGLASSAPKEQKGE